MYKCMKSSNTSRYATRTVASLSGLVETMKCHNETTEGQNDKRRRTGVFSDESDS